MTLMDFLVIALTAIIVVCVIAIAVLKSGRHKRMALCKYDPELKRPTPALSAVDREHFGREWQHVEARFTEDPRNAVVEADRVAEELLSACGYSLPEVEAAGNGGNKRTGITTFIAGERHAAAIAPSSALHATAARSYREAHQIALKQVHGQAHGKDLRRAMLDYRIVFDDLVGEQEKSDEQMDQRVDAIHARSAG